jgi:hypothetical protein
MLPVGQRVAGVQGAGPSMQVLSQLQTRPAGQVPHAMALPQSLMCVPHSWVPGHEVSQKQGTAKKGGEQGL